MGFRKERLSAVFFAVLMVTSLVAAPAIASGPGANTGDERSNAVTVQTGTTPGLLDGPPGRDGGDGPPGHDRGDANVTVPDLEENTTIESILTATERLGDLEIEDDGDAAAAANDTVDAVNASIQEYRRLQHADSRAAFEHLADAQRSLAELKDEVDGENEAIVDEISAELYAAGDASARLAVSDATVVVAANEGEFRNSGQRQAAESDLGNAFDALERADETVSDGSPDEGKNGSAERTVGPADRAKALTHLENAWKHADQALDTVEANTDPSLSLAQGQAFERNGTVLVQVEAVLTDVRPYAYDEANVTVNGNADDSLSFVAGESAGATAFGTSLVDVGSDLENATVTVTATAAHDADRTVEATHEISVAEGDVVWERPDSDEYREVDITDESSGVSVAVGGDGLHETDVSVTDEMPETDADYHAGPMVRIENASPVDEATVEIPLDEDALEREGNLSIVTWDPHSDEPWTPVETEIDRDAGVATAEVDHFSFFSVFRIEEWEDQYSDTITLDGNETDGVGDGSEIEKADFVFVIDESGSMSGSPIYYAREAAKRFVGALTDEERAGLIGYSSRAGLDQGLTRDHDALNASIDSLSAGGGTDTEAGLRTGLNHLEANNWENRSKAMILLSDGKSNRYSYPRRVADDAVDAGVEISTIGLGSSIDESELRDIAGTTGGDFYHVQNANDLPDIFERVAENQSGVKLTDSNGDGIPDLVAEMDLAMPTGEPGVVGEPLDLDPIALDTSGDGIRDNETVDVNYQVFEEDNETKLHASVTYADHHPARVDTTGDGVTDKQQVEGWEIETVDNNADAQKVAEILEDPDDDRDVSSIFTAENVSANPLVSNTDGDDLTDIEEFELGTDPERRSTVDDGYTDVEALKDPDEDPTVYSTSPPDVYLERFDSDWTRGELECEKGGWIPNCDYERPGYEYVIELLVTDRHGVNHVELRQSGVTELDESYAAEPHVEPKTEFYAEVEKVLSWLRGAETTVIAEDAHGNEGSETVATKRSIGGALATEAPVMEQRDLGKVSGLTHGAAELPDFVRLLLNEPEEMGEAIAEFTEEYIAVQQDPTKSDTEFWIQIARSMGADVHQTQTKDNPEQSPTGSPTDDVEHCVDEYLDDDRSTSNYCLFASGWYEGYSTYLVVEAVLGSKGTLKGVSSADDLRHVLDDAGEGIDTAQGLRQLDGPETKTGKVTHRITTDGGSPDIDAPRVTRHLRDDHGIETAGGINRAFDNLEGVRHLDDLSSSEQAALAARLSKSQDPSATRAFVAELDDVDDVRHLLEETDVATTNRIVDWHANPGKYRHIDSDLEASDFAYIARHNDISETGIIAREVQSDGTTNVLWLSKGTDEYGKQHIIKRHATGEITRNVDTGFYPVGGTVEKGGTKYSIPDNIDVNDIDDLIYTGIKQGSRDPDDPVALVYNPSNCGYEQSGITEMRIVVLSSDEGITTAYPVKGPDVVTVPG